MAFNDDQSILKGLDLKDPDAICRLMRFLEHHLTHSVMNGSLVDECGLTNREYTLVLNMMAAIRGNGQKYPLLLEAALRFVFHRHDDNQGILAAARAFENLAPEPVLTAPFLFEDEYEAAETRMDNARGKVDIMRIRQRLTELAPGAFCEQVYNTARSLEIEKMAAGGTGDVRDIPHEVQFELQPMADGPQGVNIASCHQCLRDNKACDFIEPECTACRSAWQKCHYTTPSRVKNRSLSPSPSSTLGDKIADLQGAASPGLYSASEAGSISGTIDTEPAASNATAPKTAGQKIAASKSKAATSSEPIAPKPATRKAASRKTAAPALDAPQPVAPKPVVSKPAAPKPAPKTAAPKPAAPKAAVPKKIASKLLPPPSDRVTRRMAKSQVQNTDNADNGTIPPFEAVGTHGDGDMSAISQAGSRKRKQQTADDDEDNDHPVHGRPSKRGKTASIDMQPATLGVKRSSAIADIDDNMNAQPAKKSKTSRTKASASSSTSTKTDGEAAKPAARGRSEQDREGKKCCNTCQAWKAITEFAAKKHSKEVGATVGYCLRCQTNKQAKNKAKADAKKSTTQMSNTATIAEDAKDAEDASHADDDALEGGGNGLDMNKTLDEIVIDTQDADDADDDAHEGGGNDLDMDKTLDEIVVDTQVYTSDMYRY